MPKPQVVFFGTGPVSRLCLEGIAGPIAIEAIITKPDVHSPSGRRHTAPVKDWAEEHSIPLHQPDTKAELADLVQPGRFTSPAGLVVDYGLIIPGAVIDTFPLGIINSHFSLLPEWRGADPITFSILSGQTVTGVTLMQVVPALDEGPVLAQAEYPIPPHTTTPQLTQSLSDLSNRLLLEHLPAYLDGHLAAQPQSDTPTPTYSRKLTKADGRLDWTKPAAQLEREIRAYIGWPGSYTSLRDTDVTITAAHVAAGPSGVAPGTPFYAGRDLAMVTGDGALVIERLIPAGKREMTGSAYLAGHPLPHS
ncbi:MAG TPA: methionyl-tRNA formyltransferase [Candidatus Saccharimonas sp.]|nr:methionyl-tRNA formyltransferase [Candidatus Saccharimonas sp.]